MITNQQIMQAFTVEIKNRNALKTLQNLKEKRFIRIVDSTDLDSPSLQGEQLSLKSFKTWISEAENAQRLDLKVAKSKWANKRKQLQKLIR